MATMSNFEKGVVDFLRQTQVGNASAILAALEGRWPDDDDPQGCREFQAGFEFAKSCSRQDPSFGIQKEISSHIPWDAT